MFSFLVHPAFRTYHGDSTKSGGFKHLMKICTNFFFKKAMFYSGMPWNVQGLLHRERKAVLVVLVFIALGLQ